MKFKLPPRKTKVTITIEDAIGNGKLRTAITFHPALDQKRPITPAVEVAMDAMQYATSQRVRREQLALTPKRKVKP